MTPEELLKPRFLLTNDYPGNNREVGSISIEIHTAEYFRKYKANFRELEWWEEREVSEMPEYVKDIGDGEIFKVREWLDNSMSVIWLNDNKKMNHTGFHQASSEHFLPATSTDYQNYLKQKTK